MKTKSLVWIFAAMGLFFFLFSAGERRADAADAGDTGDAGKSVKTVPVSLDLERLSKELERVGEMGNGRNYLTIMVDLPQRLPDEYKLFALVLDRDRAPIRKISGFMFDPELKGKNHVWFYFFLYAPGMRRHELPRGAFPGAYSGDYIKFILQKGNETVLEKVVERYDEWGSEKTPLIVNIPMPPPEIPGYLELKDYTFFAKGDYRKPAGYYVEGTLVGHNNGAWMYFTPTSDILGQEPEPEVKLPTSRGWMELSNGRTHQMMDGAAPVKPYVNGWWDGKGYFHPEPVKVQ
jgi:hypothetical protein